MKRKKILFVYYTMMLGGSTTSLLSLLESLDYTKYDVDLLLYRNEGPYINDIPQQVNLLPQACVINNRIFQIAKTVFNGTLIKAYVDGIKYCHKIKPIKQSMAYTQVSFCRKIEKEYDVAIGFLELWSDVFVNNCISAKKKVSWVHVDYEKAHMYPAIDKKMFAKSDCIVNVSTECLTNFNKAFPEYTNKSVYIPNILTKQFLIKRLQGKCRDIENLCEGLKLVSACRLAIDHKGLDRGVTAIKRLIECGYDVKWYIIGDGPDKEKLNLLIEKNKMENNIILLGAMECPYILYHNFDAFFVPSRFEGKPMAVTEAMMLDLPPIVAEYASATEQIKNNYDGIIADNSEEGIFNSLKRVCEDPSILLTLKENMKNQSYDNNNDIEKITMLLDN